MLRVIGDSADVVVAHRKIYATIAMRLRHWAAGPQIMPDGVRILAPIRVVVIEVPRPIESRRALPHGCLLHGHAVGTRFGALCLAKREPVLPDRVCVPRRQTS